MDQDEPKLEVSPGGPGNKKQDLNPETSVRDRVRVNGFFVYQRRKLSVKSRATKKNGDEHSVMDSHTVDQAESSPELREEERKDDPLPGVTATKHPETSVRDRVRVNGFFVYQRRKLSVKSRATKKNGDEHSVTSTVDGLADASVVSDHDSAKDKKHDCANTKRRDNQLKIGGDEDEPSSHSQRRQIVKAKGGEIKNSVYSQSKKLVKSSGSHIGENERNGDRLKKTGKSIVCTDSVHVSNKDGVQEDEEATDGVPIRLCKRCDKPETVGTMLFCKKCEGAYHSSCSGNRRSRVAAIDSFLCYSCVNKSSSKSTTSHSQRRQIVKAKGGEIKNSVYSQSKKLVKSSGSHIGENERNGDRLKKTGKSIVCTDSVHVSNKDGVQEDEEATDGVPIRLCKRCDKPETVGTMLFCKKCEGAFHSSCSGNRRSRVAAIDSFLCYSCVNKSSSKSTTCVNKSSSKSTTSRTDSIRRIRVGEDFQAKLPEWSASLTSDEKFVGKALECDEEVHVSKKIVDSTWIWIRCCQKDCGKMRSYGRRDVGVL